MLSVTGGMKSTSINELEKIACLQKNAGQKRMHSSGTCKKKKK